MRLAIIAVGRLRRGPERQLVDDYLKRLSWEVREHEISPARDRALDARLRREGAQLRQAVPRGALKILLDSAGRILSSEELARQIATAQEAGRRDLAFVVGGAGGLDPALKAEADLLLSFGPMTWPHLLVRAMLAEQLYRAHAILTGHPYHAVGEP